jgi:hypothetical protein
MSIVKGKNFHANMKRLTNWKCLGKAVPHGGLGQLELFYTSHESVVIYGLFCV